MIKEKRGRFATRCRAPNHGVVCSGKLRSGFFVHPAFWLLPYVINGPAPTRGKISFRGVFPIFQGLTSRGIFVGFLFYLHFLFKKQLCVCLFSGWFLCAQVFVLWNFCLFAFGPFSLFCFLLVRSDASQFEKKQPVMMVMLLCSSIPALYSSSALSDLDTNGQHQNTRLSTKVSPVGLGD